MRTSRSIRSIPVLLSALLISVATGASAQALSSGSAGAGTAGGSITQGTQRPGQPALSAPATQPGAQPGAAGTGNPLPGQGTAGSPVPPLNSSPLGGQSAIVAPQPGMPTRSSTAAEAFTMLDRGQVGYVTRADTDRIPGFMGFDNADTNRDGQLSREEFVNAWRAYSGQ